MVLLLLLLSSGFAATGAAAQEAGGAHLPDSVEVVVRQAADAWLAHVDSARYGESWRRASDFFREMFPMTRWERSARSIHDRLGAVESRTPIRVRALSTLHGAPAGEYARVEYRSHFTGWPTVREVVTLIQEDDGSWKVAGYAASGR